MQCYVSYLVSFYLKERFDFSRSSLSDGSATARSRLEHKQGYTVITLSVTTLLLLAPFLPLS
jgi:hypothetical protein